MKRYVFKLYIAGQTARSERAIANLRTLCGTELGPDEYEIVIVDTLEHPEEAEDKKIMATPTLIKESPPPIRRLIGDLSDNEKVGLSLDLQPS